MITLKFNNDNIHLKFSNDGLHVSGQGKQLVQGGRYRL